jgi:hypothetical protein
MNIRAIHHSTTVPTGPADLELPFAGTLVGHRAPELPGATASPADRSERRRRRSARRGAVRPRAAAVRR